MNLDEQLEQKIDRTKWSSHKFSDFVENISEKIKPAESGLEHYIGLAHLDSGSLKIRRFGNPKDISGDKLKIYKGDLIFAKRNAYLKRVAIADFDAVASAHSMVLRAKTDVVLKEFLPFFMLSEIFWEKAIEISVGSLSPTINWRSLAKQEFLLPPKDQQAKLAELLWAADHAMCKNSELHAASISNGCALLKQTFYQVKTSKNESCLGEVGSWSSGGTPSKKNKNYWENGSIPWISPKDSYGAVIKSTRDNITQEAVGSNRTKLFPSGAFFLVWRSGILKHTLPVCQFVGPAFAVNQDLKVFAPKSDHINSDYVRSFVSTFSEDIRRSCVKQGATVESIDTDSFLSFPIPLPKLKQQGEIVDLASRIDKCVSSSKVEYQSTKQILIALINQIF